MDDQVLVRVVNGQAHRLEQAESLAGGQPRSLGVVMSNIAHTNTSALALRVGDAFAELAR